MADGTDARALVIAGDAVFPQRVLQQRIDDLRYLLRSLSEVTRADALSPMRKDVSCQLSPEWRNAATR